MDPRLIENATFLRYYEKWQQDPTSVVFAAISETLRTNGMIDDAINVAMEGLKYHPTLITGRLALAKAYLAKGQTQLARDQAIFILDNVPNNEAAKEILAGGDEEVLSLRSVSRLVAVGNMPEDTTRHRPLSRTHINNNDPEEITEEMPIAETEEMEEAPSDHKSWHTMTMARIYSTQGHTEKAKKIYQEILTKDPNNREALAELAKL